MYPWCLVKRVKKCWNRIKTWLTNNFAEAAATLGKGASEADIKKMAKPEQEVGIEAMKPCVS